ncbi:MAG: hypothetical protein M0Z85_07605 [Gammaproteobacteria bacterium]|nr:hypothetical protein [Gammaproteobacteria bacterium]
MMTISGILYKRTSTGAIQQWSQEIDGPRYRTFSGQVGGKLVVSEWTVCQGKNLGRANATTAEEQAAREVAANAAKKRKEGYHDSIEAIDTPRQSVMLAKDYKKYVDRVFQGIYRPCSQPKLDGMRCLARKDGLWSRKGNRILSTPHIERALEPLFGQYPDMVLDGELYNHNLKADFNRIVSLCRKQKPSVQDLLESAELIQYHVYDIASDTRGFHERNQTLDFLYSRGLLTHLPLHRVATTIISHPDELNALYEAYLEDGYEGQIIRIGNAPYVNKRTDALLKRKEFQDSEFRILDIREGVGNRSGMAGYAIMELPDGRTFKPNCMGNRDHLRSLLENKAEVIGGWGTVLYFGFTPDGIPRFPRLKDPKAPQPVDALDEDEDAGPCP